jgi:hypothetical protein
MLRSVSLVRTDVSEVLSTSIIRIFHTVRRLLVRLTTLVHRFRSP